MSKPIQITKELVNLVIKNSDVIAPFVKHKHYVRGLMVLNGLHLLLKLADKPKNHSNNQ